MRTEASRKVGYKMEMQKIDIILAKLNDIEQRQKAVELLLRQQAVNKPQFIETVRYINNSVSNGSGHCGSSVSTGNYGSSGHCS